LLPNSHLAWEAKSRAFDYDLRELEQVGDLLHTVVPPPTEAPFPHLAITESAFPAETERDLMAYTHWIETLAVSDDTRLLCRLALTSILETIIYTRKYDQYLRWDTRALKARRRNEERVQRGLAPVEGIDKGDLPTVRHTFTAAFDRMLADVARLQRQ